MRAFGATAQVPQVDWPLVTRRRKVDSPARTAHLAGASGAVASVDADPHGSPAPTLPPRIRVPDGSAAYRQLAGSPLNAHGGGGGLGAAGAARLPPTFAYGLPQYLHETAEQPVARGGMHIGMRPDESRLHRWPRGLPRKPDPLNLPVQQRGTRLIPGGWPVETNKGFAQATDGPMRRDPQTHTYDGASANNQAKRMFYDASGALLARNTQSTRSYVLRLDLDSRLRRVESRATTSSLQLPQTVAYDADGCWVDHDARPSGGPFGRRPPRSYDATTLRPPGTAPAALPSAASGGGVADLALSPPPQVQPLPGSIGDGFGFRPSPDRDVAAAPLPSSASASPSPSPAPSPSFASLPLLQRGVLRSPAHVERGFREFGSINVGAEPYSGPTQSRLSASLDGGSVFSTSPLALEASHLAASQQQTAGGGGERSASPEPRSRQPRSISPARTRAPPNMLHNSMVPKVFAAAHADAEAPVNVAVAARQAALRGSMNSSTMLQRDGASYGADTDALTPCSVAAIGQSSGPQASSVMNATFFALPDKVLRANLDAASITDAAAPAVPDRATAYLGGSRPRTITHMSGSVRSSVQFAVRGSPLGDRDEARTSFRVPADVNVAERPLGARAGVNSQYGGAPLVPRPASFHELASFGAGLPGGGNAVQILAGSPYGRLSQNAYVRTDWESLAPVAVGVGASAAAASALAASLTASGQGGALPLSAVETLAPDRVLGRDRGGVPRPATVHNALRRHAGVNTPSPSPILFVPAPTSTQQHALELARQRRAPQAQQILPHSPLRAHGSFSARNGSVRSRSASPSGWSPPGGDDAEVALGIDSFSFVDEEGGAGFPAISPMRANAPSPTWSHLSGGESPLPTERSELAGFRNVSSASLPTLQIRGGGIDSLSFRSHEAAAALPRSGSPSPVRSVAVQIDKVLRATLTDIHPPDADLRRSTLGKLSAALDREGVAVAAAARGVAPAASSAGDLVLVPVVATRRSEPSLSGPSALQEAPGGRGDYVTRRRSHAVRITDVQSPLDFVRSAMGQEAMRETRAAQGGSARFPLPNLVGLPSYVRDEAVAFARSRVAQPFPQELEAPRVVHRGVSSDLGSLHHQASPSRPGPAATGAARGAREVAAAAMAALMGGSAAPPMGRATLLPRSSERQHAGEGRVLSPRSYGAVIAQLSAAVMAAESSVVLA